MASKSGLRCAWVNEYAPSDFGFKRMAIWVGARNCSDRDTGEAHGSGLSVTAQTPPSQLSTLPDCGKLVALRFNFGYR